jgi:hypothetical protein
MPGPLSTVTMNSDLARNPLGGRTPARRDGGNEWG